MEKIPEEPHRCDTCVKKERHKNRTQKLLCELLLDFAKNTTLHGLRYITERGLSIVEKIFWIITFLTSLCLCVVLMRNVWVKWQTRPVIVTLSEQLMSVSEVPFPAVTICPQAKIKQDSFNYTKHRIDYEKFVLKVSAKARNARKSLNKTEALNKYKEQNFMKKLRAMNLICNNLSMRDWLAFSDHTVIQHIQQAAPGLYDVFDHGAWREKDFNGANGFVQPVLTKEGICFTFNSLAADEMFHMDRIQRNYSYSNASNPRKGWSLEDGYSSSSPDTYPRRGRANGAIPDLYLLLTEVLDRDIICDGFYQGFKLYLHHPADLPQSSLYYYAIQPEQVASFAIKVNVMRTSNSLISYSPNIRQCYFPSEKNLNYFKVYTQNNCQLECLANYTFALCGCVWFHMPHNDSTVLCGNEKKSCVAEAFERYALQDGINNGNASLCQCLPPCNNIQYEADVFKTSFNAREFGKVQDHYFEDIFNYTLSNDNIEYYNRYKYSKIEMYFKEPQFMSMGRSELFGLTDFLANCGGLLGLFLGFSFLSLVEIFYFLTLRLSCMRRRYNEAKKKRKDTQMKKDITKNV